MCATYTVCTHTDVNAHACAIYLHIKQAVHSSGALFQNLIIHQYSLRNGQRRFSSLLQKERGREAFSQLGPEKLFIYLVGKFSVV